MSSINNLEDIFNDDSEGILNTIEKNTNNKTDKDRLIDSFIQINEYIDKYGRKPEYGHGNMNEHLLATRLKAINEEQEKVEILKEFDRHNILMDTMPKIKSIDDIFKNDDLGLLEKDSVDIFDIINVSIIERRPTDFVAKRKPIQNFQKYIPLFKKVHEELKEGKRKLVDFNGEASLREGCFYLHKGLVFLLEKVNITREEQYLDDGTRVRRDGRTHCIFENGLKSNMLIRSVAKALYEDGKVITENLETQSKNVIRSFNNITEEDLETGHIYILKSHSNNPNLEKIENLYKIGFSIESVTERIKNSETEPTYLMSKVSIVKSYKCYNLNPQKLEQLLHNFFGQACLNIDIIDNKGQRHMPREWFIAPLHIIDTAVKMILNGDITNYRYDTTKQEIITI